MSYKVTKLQSYKVTKSYHGDVEVVDGGEDEAGRDVEDAPEVVVEVGHGEDGDPDTEELCERLRVLEERRDALALAGVVETPGHQLAPVDGRLCVMSPVEGEHDGRHQGQVGDGQDQPHRQLGVVGLGRGAVGAGGAAVARLAGAGGEEREAGTEDLPAVSVRAAASRALARPH